MVRNLVTTCSPANCPPKCSALGHKRTYAVQKGHVRFTPNSDHESGHVPMVMSALPPKADM